MRVLGLLGLCGCSLSCGTGLVPSPFGGDDADAGAGADADAGMSEGSSTPPLASTPDEVLGGPCTDDAQCDDGVECTFGACDPVLNLCRFTADDARCADGMFCNGIEQCHPSLGCRPGPPTSCSDSTPCTIDRCDEATRSCTRSGRDFDRDGDVDGNCSTGSDCDDMDPFVASTAPEVCLNAKDDDCDGEIDEAACAAPEHDVCADALAIEGPASHALSTAGALLDYAPTCAPEGGGGRELVLMVDVPPDRDVDIAARSSTAALALARVGTCGEPGSEIECLSSAGAAAPFAARLRIRAADAGQHFVYLLADAAADIQLDVSHIDPLPVSNNRECGTRVELSAGVPVEVDLAFAGTPLDSACPTDQGDLFYEFTLAEPSDVRVFAQNDAGVGLPRISLRTPACGGIEAELACAAVGTTPFQARALAAGTYVLAASALGPARYAMILELRPPSTPPASDRCVSAPTLSLNQSETQRFEQHVDDIDAGCSPGRLDAARRLVLEEPSDVLVFARFAGIDTGAVALADISCSSDANRACTEANGALARVSQRALPAGQYAVVLESQLGSPTEVTAAVRKARAPVLVPSADDCAAALLIGSNGGFFQGNTGNAANDYTASCDFATPSGAPDQLLRLVLDSPRRMIFDMRGSDFETLLNVRRGPACPGEEVPAACVVMGGGDRSFLDVDLPAGEYFVQIDGYAGASGSWFLDVYALEP